ncbi:IS256 family transposase [Corynebacterium diphtheriae]|nr:IS256 family transposase [Corynebacterium diphtheriae]CAB0664193.1 IS256 family transposase [Corynebacterium diphtheriae]
MTTVARRDPADRSRLTRPEEKLLAHPEIAKLIDELGTSTTDARLGYQSGDREAKAAAGIDNYRNGTYPKTVDSNDGPVTADVPQDRAGMTARDI